PGIGFAGACHLARPSYCVDPRAIYIAGGAGYQPRFRSCATGFAGSGSCRRAPNGALALAAWAVRLKLVLPAVGSILADNGVPGSSGTSDRWLIGSQGKEVTQMAVEPLNPPPEMARTTTAPMIAPFGRSVTYLRVSVADGCDFRCVYCM